MAILEAHRGGVPRVPPALPVQRRGAQQHVLDLASVGAGVHAKRAADRARNAGQELEAGQTRVRREPGHVDIERAGAGSNARIGPLRRRESVAQPDHDAGNSAVADQQIGGDADGRDRNVRGRVGKEVRQVLLVRGNEQCFRRPACAEPCKSGEGNIGAQLAPHRRQAVDHAVAPARGGHVHHDPSASFFRTFASCSGSAFAQ